MTKTVVNVNAPLLEARQKYREGQSTLGDYFAVLDRFLDDVPEEAPVAPPVPPKKET